MAKKARFLTWSVGFFGVKCIVENSRGPALYAPVVCTARAQKFRKLKHARNQRLPEIKRVTERNCVALPVARHV
jgi:hypothetical protein